MDGKLHLYVDRMSQPSRAVLIFCRMNNIDAQIHLLNILKGENRTEEFKAINPMAQVPAIDDAGYKLFESHAILRYLACTRPGIQDHWYPTDASRRARIDSVLDWHHSNLRRGSAAVVLHLVINPLLGRPSNEAVLKDAEGTLRSSLLKMETVWLKGETRFLGGSSQPSIADLSLACELKQLDLLDSAMRSDLFGHHQKIKRWMSAVQTAMSPHFEEVHSTLFKAAKNAERRREQEADYIVRSKL